MAKPSVKKESKHFYQSTYTLKNPEKYRGKGGEIICRSSWERSVCCWCDREPIVEWWSSEEDVIPYYYSVDRKFHRYYIDFKIKFRGGQTLLVEVKPKNQTVAPKKRGRTVAGYVKECMKFEMNQCKWRTAKAYAEKRGWKFFVWTEDELRKLGIPILTGK